MTSVMQGVRVLEVAEHTFVPAASALLSDWGADVIKIEHVERGDAMRGLASTGTAAVPTHAHVLLEHSNRGKRSLGLDLTSEEGLEILYKLVAMSDVFLTNKLPSVRKKLKIDLETSGRTTRRSFMCAARVRESGGRTRTRVPTTRWRSGRAPVSLSGSCVRSTVTCRVRPLLVSGTRSGR